MLEIENRALLTVSQSKEHHQSSTTSLNMNIDLIVNTRRPQAAQRTQQLIGQGNQRLSTTTIALPYPTANPCIQFDEVPGIRQTSNSDSETRFCSDGILTYFTLKQSFSWLTYHHNPQTIAPGILWLPQVQRFAMQSSLPTKTALFTANAPPPF